MHLGIEKERNVQQSRAKEEVEVESDKSYQNGSFWPVGLGTVRTTKVVVHPPFVELAKMKRGTWGHKSSEEVVSAHLVVLDRCIVGKVTSSRNNARHIIRVERDWLHRAFDRDSIDEAA